MAQLGRRQPATSPVLVRPIARGGAPQFAEGGAAPVGAASTAVEVKVAGVVGVCAVAVGGFETAGTFARARAALVVSKPVDRTWLTVPGASIGSAPLEVTPPILQTGSAATGAALSGAAKKVVAVGGRLCVGLRTARYDQSIAVGFTHVTVTRDYDLATGDAPTGAVYFTPSDWLVNDGVTIPAARVTARLDAQGAITIDLAANTDPDTVPTGSSYTVREEITGQPVRTYQVIIPHDIGSVVDLSGLGGSRGYGTSGYGTSGYGL